MCIKGRACPIFNNTMACSTMVRVSPRMHPSSWLVFLISIISTISDGRAQARILMSDEVKGFDKPKGAVKTIESYESSEVIDCVDIFKQPAFDHPHLKNHNIQMKPSSNVKANGTGHVERALSQTWWKYGECPEGTIPIVRPPKHNHRHVIPSTPRLKRLNQSQDEFNPPKSEYAQVQLNDGNFLGAEATINVWNPDVMDHEASFSGMWLVSGTDGVLAGSMVDADSSLSEQAKLFAYWTADAPQHTGCYNLDCPGFVQTSSKYALGSRLKPVSTYDGQQYDLPIKIVKNYDTGHWWLSILDVPLGYWPKEIFTSLSGPANLITWGGQILNVERNGLHTSTEMGSGHFPSEGYGKAAYFRHLRFVDTRFLLRDPENLKKQVTRSECYDLQLGLDPTSTYGVNFYYGGSGFSAQCAK